MKQVTYKPLKCNDELAHKDGNCPLDCVKKRNGSFYVCPALFTDK